jgi:hypothetical protein
MFFYLDSWIGRHKGGLAIVAMWQLRGLFFWECGAFFSRYFQGVWDFFEDFISFLRDFQRNWDFFKLIWEFSSIARLFKYIINEIQVSLKWCGAFQKIRGFLNTFLVKSRILPVMWGVLKDFEAFSSVRLP